MSLDDYTFLRNLGLSIQPQQIVARIFIHRANPCIEAEILLLLVLERMMISEYEDSQPTPVLYTPHVLINELLLESVDLLPVEVEIDGGSVIGVGGFVILIL